MARIDSAAPPRASLSSLVRAQPVNARRWLKRDGGLYGVLALHAVGDKENLVRLDGLLDALQLVHHLFVDTQAARRVYERDAAVSLAGLGRCRDDRWRLDRHLRVD